MTNIFRAAALGALLLLQPLTAPAQTGSGGRNRLEHQDGPYVIVVSFDGFRHDYLDRVETPSFDRVVRGGARADGLIPVFPSKTFPNHYSIATGLYAENHGLIDNAFWDPYFQAGYALSDRSAVEDGRWYGGEPIWVTAEKQGMVSAAYFFVGTEAPIQGVRPTHYRTYDGKVSNEARVAQLLEWLEMPPEERPHLLMLYFSDVDDAGHDSGPDSPDVRRAVEEVDRALGQLLDGVARLPIAERVHFVLVSDHGMAALDTARVEYLDDFAELEGVRVYGNGPYAVLWTGEDPARRERVYRRLDAGLRHARVFRREEVPQRFRYRNHRRAGDLLVLAEPGWQLTTRAGRVSAGGAHGYDPATRDMHGIFLAMGPKIRAGVRVPAFENVHVYPFVAHLLALAPNPAVDGRLEVLRPLLRQPPHQGLHIPAPGRTLRLHAPD